MYTVPVTGPCKRVSSDTKQAKSPAVNRTRSPRKVGITKTECATIQQISKGSFMLGSHKGFTAIEVILVVVAVAALGFAGGTWWQANQDSQTFIREQSGTDNEDKDEKEKEEPAPIVFKATELEPGDKVGTMEAVSVEKFREEVQGEQQELRDDNVSAKFNGEVSVKGTYVKRSGVREGLCLEDLADPEKDKLPRTEGDTRDHFCFDNESEVESKLSGQEGREVTVTIGDYHYKSYPSTVVNSARLVEVE